LIRTQLTLRPLEAQQPGHGAFDDPAVAPELGLVLDAAAGDADLDPSPVQRWVPGVDSDNTPVAMSWC